MSDKLISLESALKEIRRFKGYIDDDMIERFSIAFKRLSHVPREMTAREYIREYRLMHRFYFGKPATDGGMNGCGDCPCRLNGKKNCIFSPTRDESSIPIVEKFAREHPEEKNDEPR